MEGTRHGRTLEEDGVEHPIYFFYLFLGVDIQNSCDFVHWTSLDLQVAAAAVPWSISRCVVSGFGCRVWLGRSTFEGRGTELNHFKQRVLEIFFSSRGLREEVFEAGDSDIVPNLFASRSGNV